MEGSKQKVFFWVPESTMLPQISYTRGYLTGRALLYLVKQKQKTISFKYIWTFSVSQHPEFQSKTFYFCFLFFNFY